MESETTADNKTIEDIPPQLSVAVIAERLIAGTAAAQRTDTFGGQVMDGPVVSNTVMVCAQVAELPQASVALNTRLTV